MKIKSPTKSFFWPMVFTKTNRQGGSQIKRFSIFSPNKTKFYINFYLFLGYIDPVSFETQRLEKRCSTGLPFSKRRDPPPKFYQNEFAVRSECRKPIF